MFTAETVDILDQSDELSACIKDSYIYQEYIEAKHQLETNFEVKILRQKFDQIKSHYDDCLRFGRYHPDYSRVMKETRQQREHMKCIQLFLNLRLKKLLYKIY